MTPPREHPEAGTEQALALLRRGRMEVTGRLADASNATLLCAITLDGLEAECVYKPVRGERPLWDFPDGTLAGREVATYLVSEAAGFGVVPPTVLRDGPFGTGMVQLWIDTDCERELVDIVEPREAGRGWRTVLKARGASGDPALLVHADEPTLRRMAALDVVVNNADRKGGHVLAGVDGRVYGVDHGLCLHREDKLRTVLWGWVGEPLSEDVVEGLGALRAALHPSGPFVDELGEHVTRAEVAALRSRTRRLIEAGELPGPGGGWPPIPWPAF